MATIIFLIILLNISTGLIRNIICIYDFFTRKEEEEEVSNTKQKLTEKK